MGEPNPGATEVDVLIVGAGISGICAAHHLQKSCPDRSFVILEGREHIGGTWDLFRYPGIRSDSDMYTLGFSFRPWTEEKAIADGDAILRYLNDTVREHGIEDRIRFGHHVKRATWSSDDARWQVDAERTDTGASVGFRCKFILMCSGYYNYEHGYTPAFPGLERFGGQLVHPQHWTPDVDYAGKRVVIIGSGATAVTLLPNLAKTATHVTMLQRSPTYIVARPARDELADKLRRNLPARIAYELVRWKNVLLGMFFFWMCKRRPAQVRRWILGGVRQALGPDYDIRKHFSPKYQPWDQRMCLAPDGDFFAAIRDGKASVATDTIQTFTETGIQLASGEHLDADMVVTATGLELKFLGGLDVHVDGQRAELPKTMLYKGMMLSGVPNLAMTIGYTNASWTLKCELTCQYVCRLLNHMQQHGFDQCRVRVPDGGVQEEPVLALSSGYIQRSVDSFPRQGVEMPWKLYQNYALDKMMLGYGNVADPAVQFTTSGQTR